MFSCILLVLLALAFGDGQTPPPNPVLSPEFTSPINVYLRSTAGNFSGTGVMALNHTGSEYLMNNTIDIFGNIVTQWALHLETIGYFWQSLNGTAWPCYGTSSYTRPYTGIAYSTFVGQTTVNNVTVDIWNYNTSSYQPQQLYYYVRNQTDVDGYSTMVRYMIVDSPDDMQIIDYLNVSTTDFPPGVFDIPPGCDYYYYLETTESVADSLLGRTPQSDKFHN